MKKTTEHVIFSSYDTYAEENMKEERQCYIDNGTPEEDITDDMLMRACEDNERYWFDDEMSMLKHDIDPQITNGIIAIADLGLWNGQHRGYKDMSCIADALYSDCDYEKLYVDGRYNLRKTESHHDGTNCILYRAWKDGISETRKDNFREKLYSGKATERDISRYTTRIGHLIARVYGF